MLAATDTSPHSTTEPPEAARMPDAPIELTVVDLPLEHVWHRLVEVAGLGYATYGPIVYVGPTGTARGARLRT